MKFLDVQLKIGNTYRVKHKRKGEFVVQLIGIVKTNHPAEVDDYFLTCRYDVRAGTDQARLAFVPGKEQIRTSNLRPSLIDGIEIIKEHWLRDIKLPEPVPETTGIKKMLNKFRGGE